MAYKKSNNKELKKELQSSAKKKSKQLMNKALSVQKNIEGLNNEKSKWVINQLKQPTS